MMSRFGGGNRTALWRRLRTRTVFVAWVALAFAHACARTNQTLDGQEQSLFRADVERVVVEVDAMPGTLVRFHRLPSGVRPWDITRANLRRVIGPNVREVVVPAGWPDVGTINTGRTTFSADDLIELSADHAQPSAPGEVRFHVMILDGTFVDESGQLRPEVEGAHVERTNVVAYFGQHVRDIEPDLAAIFQQLTIVHELGHAAGLVNLETPQVRPHERIDDGGSHCAVPTCVMHSKDAHKTLLTRLRDPGLSGPDALVVFGPACLADLDARRAREHDLP